MDDLKEAAEEAAEMAAAERVARAELIRRNERLGREAKTARATAGKLFAAGAVASMMFAAAATTKGTTSSSSSSRSSDAAAAADAPPSGFADVVYSTGGYVLALVMALWAAVFSKPSVAVIELSLIHI